MSDADDLSWRPYYGDRLIADHPGGFYVIVPSNDDPAVPLCCGNCGVLMSTSDDEAAYNMFGCCSFCADRWAYARASEWNHGWRPPQQEVDVALADRQRVYQQRLRNKILTNSRYVTIVTPGGCVTWLVER